MDTIRRGLIEAADGISIALQNAGKSFGFLEDGRDLVEVVETGPGQVTRLQTPVAHDLRMKGFPYKNR